MTISSVCSISSGCQKTAKRLRSVLIRILFVAVAAVALAACDKKTPRPDPGVPEESASTEESSADTTPAAADGGAKTASPSRKPAKPAPPPPQKKVPVSTAPAPAEIWKQFSAERAWRTAKDLAALGPRPTGSMELGRARALLISALEKSAWEVEQREFTIQTANGEAKGVNLIARFSADGVRPVPPGPRAVLLGAHYDTRYFSTMPFIGANEGASGPAVLAEAARALALDPQLAAKVEIVLFDAHEPRGQYSAENGVWGAKDYARTNTAGRGLILHGVGDAGSPLLTSAETKAGDLAELRGGIAALKSTLQIQPAAVKLWGDHLPFGERALLLGNYDSLHRYTMDDTIERVDPAALGKVGELVLWLAKRWATQAP